MGGERQKELVKNENRRGGMVNERIDGDYDKKEEKASFNGRLYLDFMVLVGHETRK